MSLALTSRRTALLPGRWVSNELWRRARAVPSLDLRFAENKSLVDSVSGQNLITFTRASTGTFVDSDGVIRSAATNLRTYSEEFDNAAWIKVRSSITANAAVAPNGTQTADKFIASTDASTTHFIRQDFSATSGVTYTQTLYAKAGEYSQILLGFDGDNGTFAAGTVVFTLTGGGSANTPVGAITSSSIQALPNGWFRCHVSATATATATGVMRTTLISGGSGTFTGDGTSGIYLWGAQLEVGSTATTYLPTGATINSAPRFDHNPLTGECLGLLVEEQRTNSISNNTMVGAVAGTPGTLPTGWPFQVGNNGLSVSIVGTGIESGIAYLDWRISGTATAAAIGDICFGRGSALTAQTWIVSSYLKLVSGSLSGVTGATLSLIEETAANAFVTGALYSIALPTTASLITQRPAASRTLTGGATVALLRTNLTFNVSSGSTVDFTVRIGLPQLEQGAFATSVIPTTGTAATRTADVASISGTNFSSWYSQTAGTLFALASRPTTVTQNNRIAAITDGTINNRLFDIRQDSSTSGFALSVIAGSGDMILGVVYNGTSLPNKAAVAQELNNANVAYNGTLAAGDTSVLMPSVNSLQIGSLGGSGYYGGHISRLTYFPQRLPNSTLQSITL